MRRISAGLANSPTLLTEVDVDVEDEAAAFTKVEALAFEFGGGIDLGRDDLVVVVVVVVVADELK